MKSFKKFFLASSILYFFSCSKSEQGRELIPVPNGDFETWNTLPVLTDWKTNSCPECTTPINMYVVQKITDAYSGQYAAKLTYYRNIRSQVYNKFFITA